MTDCLHKRRTLDVTNRTTDLSNHKIERISLSQHPPFDFICDMGNYLYRLAEIVTMTFPVDDGLVDASRGDAVISGGVNTSKAFVMSQVKVGFHTVNGHIALTMFIGVQRPRIDVDIRVKLLNSDFIAPCLEQFANTGRDDAFSKRRDHTACNENKFCFHIICCLMFATNPPPPSDDGREGKPGEIKVAA